MKSAKFIKALINTIIISLCFSYLSCAEAKKIEGALVCVGDATLTYASYFFILPTNWIPLMDNIEFTHERGFWRGKHKYSQIWMQIVPTRKEPGQSFDNFIEQGLQQTLKDGNCSSDALKEYLHFEPSIDLPHKVYSLFGCPTGVYGILVFVDLPEHVITFNLFGIGKDEIFLTSYFEDFNRVIGSFRWVLGLSDEEIGEKLKELQ